MTKCQVPAVLIHQIEEELDKEEVDMMVFLCRDLAPDLATAGLRELLGALNERDKLSLLGLSELLYRVKRFDLLRRILKTEKTTVEANLTRNPRLVPDYRVLMVEINENLEKEEVSSLVFLLRDFAPRMKMAKDKNVNKAKSQNGEIFFQVFIFQFPQVYRMQSHPLGVCLIIDCIGYDTEGPLADRSTTVIDGVGEEKWMQHTDTESKILLSV
ncbi:hypothetical protein CIB84_005229 [Bambusicola thoracicus]|uniref:DED domain-containing protein n=1 Tax=Bambusicola thoracicus TaxID=9083 RepID=A0A2P4T3T0_BAMTH|nr:hypothetical protein CIB84_005229 [Bambusicola thoracicus]